MAAFTLNDIEEIDKLIASGVATVKTPDGKEVTLRSLRELLATKNAMGAARGDMAAVPTMGRGVYSRGR